MTTTRTRYLPGLDGVRAWSVLGVVVGHSMLKGAEAFVSGVYVFFVLSGFLITLLIVDEINERGKLDVVDFYIRRIARLVPALWAMLLVLMVVSLTMIPPPFGEATRYGIVYNLFYIQNIAAAYYKFFPYGWMGMLQHTWTLGVEVQFYIVWPVILSAFGGFRTRGLAWALIGAVAVLLFMLKIMVFDHVPIAYAANATEMNIGPLMLGASGALWMRSPYRRSLRFPAAMATFALAGVVLVCFDTHILGDTIGSPAAFPFFVSILSLVCIISIAQNADTMNSVFFTSAPIDFIGKISYSLYLWHFPVSLLIYANKILVEYPVTSSLLKVFLSFIPASISYFVVEKPMRKSIRSALERIFQKKLRPSE